MRSHVLFVAFFLLHITFLSAQEEVLPNYHAPSEMVQRAKDDPRAKLGIEITTPPPFEVRTMAEWEEIQGLVITWAGFSHILKQIAAHARMECEVIIIAENESSVTNFLMNSNAGGPGFTDLDNITILEEDFNSIWGRDYGAHTIYRDDVEELLLVDWIYNRNRPADDLTPISIAQHYGTPLYSTTTAPYDLMATGGNFMSDGLGTAFSSELILDENNGGSTWWTDYPDHSEDEINDILYDFMGIDRYIKMDVLPYDLIHHIDMHMKLLDEETLIMGEYPAGVADGPQIEANLEYVLNNFNSVFGTPYEVVRVQMPPEGGSYPNTNGAYRTYTNMVFVNGTVLVPVYEEQYDTPALEVIQSELPGYNVVGIECNDIIELSGAIHCITKAVGVADPLLIVHDHLDDTEDDLNDYQVDATIQHMSDISAAEVMYRVDGGAWNTVAMTQTSVTDDLWTGYIPAQVQGSEIQYYIHATANSSKEQVRPIVAPEGHWTFHVLGGAVGIDELEDFAPVTGLYPNPASEITVVELDMLSQGTVSIQLKDMLGRTVLDIFQGQSVRGEQKYFFDASNLVQGVYRLQVTQGERSYATPLMVK